MGTHPRITSRTASSIIRAAKAIGADEANSGSQEDWRAIDKECKERTKALVEKLKDLLKDSL